MFLFWKKNMNLSTLQSTNVYWYQYMYYIFWGGRECVIISFSYNLQSKKYAYTVTCYILTNLGSKSREIWYKYIISLLNNSVLRETKKKKNLNKLSPSRYWWRCWTWSDQTRSSRWRSGSGGGRQMSGRRRTSVTRAGGGADCWYTSHGAAVASGSPSLSGRGF